jgi:hypothetical protein
MKRVSKAETFRHAYTVFAREIWPQTPHPDHIANLLLATDCAVLFDINESETIVAIFSDGSRAIIHPETLQ